MAFRSPFRYVPVYIHSTYTTNFALTILVLCSNRAQFTEGYRDEYPVIELNNPEANREQEFPKNEIWTTKYSIFSFLPKVIYEQFRKFTSFYFLLVCIISFVPSISPINPWSSVSGLLFILSVSMIREAVEDFFRLRADLRANRRHFITLEPGTAKHRRTRCQNIRVGDLVYITANQPIPADIVVVSSALDDSICYIETAQLDGETNLKLRRAPSSTHGLTAEEVACVKGNMHCDVPVHELYKFKGTIDVTSLGALDAKEQAWMTEPSSPAPYKGSMNGNLHTDTEDQERMSARLLGSAEVFPEIESEKIEKKARKTVSFKGKDPEEDEGVADMTPQTPQMLRTPRSMRSINRVKSVIGIGSVGPTRVSAAMQSPLDSDNMLPRGCILRNTPWIVGLVVYAGPETKLSLNTKTPPSKFSSLDKRINKYVLGIFFMQCLTIFAVAVLAGFFEKKQAPLRWYLGVKEQQTVFLTATRSFFSYFILMSYLIPISLVVTLEVTKVLQGRFMEWDQYMHYGKRRMTVKTSNLNDELGLVQYIFSDKTGTLTQNQMDFRKVRRGTSYHRFSLIATCVIW